MTTLAYKSGILAADTQMTDGTLKVPMRKLFLLGAKEGCIAICGDVARAVGFINWLQAGGDPTKWKRKQHKGVGAIYLDKWDEPFWFNDSPNPVPITAPFFAMGTGYILATGAMKTGMSAIDAVKFAGSLDTYTNEVVDYYSTKTKKIKRST